MQKYEEDLTNSIKRDTSRNKKLWQTIDKLRGKSTKAKLECKLYDCDGKLLSKEEADTEIEKFWKNIYQKHENNIEEVWNAETRKVYQELLDQEQHDIDITRYKDSTFPAILREHFDCQLCIHGKIAPMDYPHISHKEMSLYLRKIKKNKATGPDKVKGELYSLLEKSEICTSHLQNTLQDIVDKEIKIASWEKSKTTMIPKVNKPMASQLRPIALTNVSYKLYMTIQGRKIDQHILETNEQIETQAGFTTGGQIEDNLFVLQYCIEKSYRMKKELIVTCIDYSKAFDSIKRDKIIEALMHYRIHPKIIDTIAKIYQNDSTEIQIGELRKNINITSGIRQGCTGSTMLFKLITYMIISELNRRGTGYRDENVNIESLYFADDGLLLANSVEDAKNNLKIVIQVSREFGLEINKEKSNVMIFNMKEQPEQIEGIKVVDRIKYLGIEIDNKRNYFKTQRIKILEKARKLANMTYAVIEKSCNKLLIGKTYWKSVALPSILYGINVINLSEDDIKSLQTIENSVYRAILGAPDYAPNSTLRSEIGASLMKTRIINTRINYMKRMCERNKLLGLILHNLILEQNTKWIKVSMKYLDEVKLHIGDVETKSKREIKQICAIWDNEQWKSDINSKSTLKVYRHHKKQIQEEHIYNNHPSSVIWYKARINALQLNDRNRHTNKETRCIICENEIEN